MVQECDFDQEPGCTEWYQAAGSHAGQTNKSIGHSPDRLIANGKKKRMISSGDNGSWRLAPGYVFMKPEREGREIEIYRLRWHG